MMTHSPARSLKRVSLCSTLAIATSLVVGPSPAAAQAFQGTVSSSNGISAPVIGSGTTTIDVTAPQAVINWDATGPSSGGITTFQSSGTTATFQGASDFAVLNRVSPSVASDGIFMGGMINSLVGGQVGGTVYFYSPNGIVIGQNASINVGALGLTTSPITDDGLGNWMTGFGTGNPSVSFGAANPGSYVRTDTAIDGSINALNSGSYVAMVAPRVEHRGTINVNGSAALVGAEAATINFSPDGLFDIQVTTGTTDANGVYNSGTITGPASTGAADIHRAYLVAVPKNNALTMAIIQGGSLGFDIAGAANVDGNTVVLSAGYNVTDGVINTSPASAGGANKANLNVNGANMTSALNAAASGIADIFSNAGQTSNFASDVTARAVDHVWINASGSSATLNIAGNLDMSTVQNGSVDGQSNTGGFVALYAGPGGTLTVGGNASLNALGYGGSSSTAGLNGGTGTGGQAWVQSEGDSTLSIGGDLTVSALGLGGSAGAAGANGGAGNGGQIYIRKFGTNSLLSVGGSTTASADGSGGNATACLGCSGSGGIGTGGQVSVYSSDDSGPGMTLDGVVSLQASGHGGSSATGGAGGGGTGGSVSVSAGTGSTLALNSRLYAAASAFGGSGSAGGSALGGSASIFSGGTLTIAGIDGTYLYADAEGGMGLSAAAGDAQGGTITILADDGGSLTLTNSLYANADGLGGHAGDAGADGGDGTGGTIALYATGDGSTISANDADLHANGAGGRGDGLECFSCNGNGGDGTGGNVFVGDGFYFSSLSANNSINFAGSLTMAANGTGGVGVGISGDGTGGHAELSWFETTIGTIDGIVAILAIGDGGDNNVDGGIAGSGTGGGAIIGPDGGLTMGADVYVVGTGYGGSAFGIDGTGGTGTGGVARLFNGLGTITIAGNYEGYANGLGGDADLGTAGDGFGGLAPLNGTGGDIAISGSAQIGAAGYGGDGDSGGDGYGGTARFVADNADVSIGSSAIANADGYGGDGAVFGGDGFGGSAYLLAVNGATLDVTGAFVISADALGGDGDSGGSAYGGLARIRSEADGAVWLRSLVLGSADAFGGYGTTGPGGDAYGGTFQIYSTGTGSSATLLGSVIGSADAFGGGSDSGAGAYAQGGLAETYTDDSGYMLFAADFTLSADAYGGDGATGGAANGGNVNAYSNSGGSLFFDGFADLYADGYGGYGYDGDGGSGTGGNVNLNSSALIEFSDSGIYLSATGYGGGAEVVGTTSGVGIGGGIQLQADLGGSLTVAGPLYAYADGFGGDIYGFGVDGGSGHGGNAVLQAFGANATVTLGSSVDISANGKAGSVCIECGGGGIGGNGTGGNVTVQAFGAATSSMTIAGNLFAEANGGGGDGITGAAGDGTGGAIYVAAKDGAVLHIGLDFVANAEGDGGYSFGPGDGGQGIGGGINVNASNGGTLDVDGSTFVDADGYGGDAGIIASGNGGYGQGGKSWINADSGGLIDIAGSVYASGSGEGGSSDNGTGGYGLGNYAGLYVDGGDINVGGSAFVSASGQGGDGIVGGNGTGGSNIDDPIDVGAEIFAWDGDITIAGTAAVDASGFGGNGAAGGNGGNGTGGKAIVESWGSQPSSILASLVVVTAEGHGGDGGAGLDSNDGGNGGNGGTGIGGWVGLNGSAAGGTLDVGASILSAQAFGGNGGAGGNGIDGAGGNGGTGGSAAGGSIQVGTVSNDTATATGGGATFTTIFADTSAFGGNGGDGGTGGGGDGAGGNGGAAAGGISMFLVRGVLVTADTVQLAANATGGNGGNGATQGNGGAATAGDILVESKDRFNHADQRGTLVANAITGDAVATGGLGAINGGSFTDGGSYFRVLNGDATIGSVDINIAAQTIVGTLHDFVSVRDGVATITGDFNFSTSGLLALDASNGSMSATNIGLTAGNFVPDTFNPAPSGPGTYFANLINITSGLNIYTTANLDSILGLNLTAAGFIVTGNLNGNAGDVFVDAQGGLVDVGNVNGGFVRIQASESVNADDITSGSNIQVTSGTDITLGDLVAGVTIDPQSDKAVRLDANGSILVGDITALGGIDFSATGSMTGGNVITGDVLGGDADGAVTFGTISAGLINPQGPTQDGFSVGFGSGTSISVGDVAGAEAVGFATLGSLTTGDITAGTDVLAMASGDMTFGAITAGANGRTYLADSSMFIAAGGPDNFNPSLVFGAPPVASTGSITILGPVSTGSFQAAGASILAGNFDAISFIQMITSSGGMTLGNLVAGLDPIAGDAVSLDSGGSILMGNVTALGGIDFDAAGSVTGLNITTGSELGGGADGAVSLGNISAGLVNPQGPVADGFSVELSSGTSISVGTVAGAEGVAFATPGALTTGNITAGTDVLAMASGNMSFGSITATGRTYLADFSMFELSQTGPDFDPAPIFAATPVASTGSITIGGPVSTGSFQAAGASITAGNINADSFIQMISSGSISFNTLVAGTFVTIDPTDIVGGDVTALAGDVDMTGNSIDIGNVSASDNVFLTALAGDLSTGTIDAGFDVTLNASGDVTTSHITAGGLIDATGASLTLGNLSAYSIALTTTVADLTVGNVTIPGNLALTTAGDLVFGDLVAYDVDLSATGAIDGGDIDSATDITALAGTNMSLGDLQAGGFFIETFLIGNISLTAGGGITTLTQSAFGDVLMDAGGDIATGDIAGASITAFAGGDIDTGDLTTQQLVQLFSFVPGVSVWLDSGGDITTGDISSFDSVHAQAVGGIGTGAIGAQGFVELFAGGNVSTGAINAIDYIDVAANGSILVASATSGEDIDFDAGTTINGGNVTAGDSITALANGNITLGALSAGLVNPSTEIDAGYSVGLATNGSINTGAINAAADIGLGAAGTITTGNLNADGTVLALGGGNMSFGSIAAGALGQLYIADFSMITLGGTLDNFDPLPILAADPVASAGSITIGGPVSTGWMRAAGAGITSGNIGATTFIDLLSTGGMTLGNLTAGENIELTSGGAVTLLNASAGEIIDFDGIGGSLTGGSMTAGDSVEGNAQGSIQLGALSAGLVNPSTAVDAEHSVKLASLNGSINVGTVSASADVAMAAAGTMTTGNINASGLVALLADGNMSLGSITTAGNGRVLLADFSMLALGGDVGTDTFDISLVLAADPVATSGSITIGGPVSTGLFQATAGQGLSAGAITAQTIDASAGGTATVSGNWSANGITLASNDIDITASGFLNAGLVGPLTLISTNATQALIGDGVTGTGYALSNAEFGRLHGGAVSVLANGAASAAQDMLIGDLSITGPLAGSTIDNPNGIVVFATGDLGTLTPGGVIRVVGDVEATGFQAGNALEFATGLFEVDAATGSISVEGLNNALGGILDITADRIHVASGAILNQLAANPHYAGYQNDLNAPAAVQRPEGVIRASQIFVQPTEAVLVQNTGTAEVPAGFIANSAELTVPEGAPAGSIELIVNGQLVTETGTLTGIAARDAYVVDTDLAIYSDISMINGCALVGPCEVVPPPPEEPPVDPVGDIATEITLISEDVLSEQPFGNEPIIDDQDDTEDDESSSPIEPPAPLFNTRPLNPDADVDEPISGSGNPALMGAGPVNDGEQP